MYETIGFKAHYESIDQEEKSIDRSIILISDEKCDDLVIPFIRDVVPWKAIKSIAFCCLSHRLTPIINNFICENDLGKPYIYNCEQLEIDKQTFMEMTKDDKYSCPSGD